MANRKRRPVSSALVDFAALLAKPDVDQELPEDFNEQKEAAHLERLYKTVPEFRDYHFLSFIHAGGSGLQFRVQPKAAGGEQAMKIARAHFFPPTTNDGPFSPVSQNELNALELFGHPNLVRLFKVIQQRKATIALCTTLVKDGLPIVSSLDRAATSTYCRSAKQDNPNCSEIDLLAQFLIDKFADIASALAHMHEHGVYHFDVKSENILVSAANDAILTDMGSCVFFSSTDSPKDITTRVTWAYAHPDMQNIIKSHAAYIEGGGLKTRVTVRADATIAKYDLYAFAKTIQECLARVDSICGQQSFASYPFRFLYLVACLLLDGKNRTDSGIRDDNGHYFVDDVALGYPKQLFAATRISTARDLHRVLRRFGHHNRWTTEVPELDHWVPNTINTGVGRPVAYTKRVEEIMIHPAINRLRNEVQLGWVRAVFPGAENNRWAHTLGVFGRVICIYDALLSDPEVPTALIFLGPEDIEVALVAALLHDAGQTSFGHDFESVLPTLEHEQILSKLLDDERWKPTLRKTINEFWPRVSISRVLGVLGLQPDAKLRPVDGIAKDIISGPIDADKQDYLQRDSISCGVPYGNGIDHDRLLRSLTVAVKGRTNLSLAYKAKGRSAFESLLFARYHMYTAVYWHHAFRSIQAMFLHATTAAITNDPVKTMIQDPEFREVYYKRVICGLPWEESAKEMPILLARTRTDSCFEPKVHDDRAIDLLWFISDTGNRLLVERMARRSLHKRIFEINVGHISHRVDATYNDIKSAIDGIKRIEKAKALEDSLIERLCDKAPSLKEPLNTLRQSGLPLIILDLPTRGVPRERNIPFSIGDSFRKYFKMAETYHLTPGARTFEIVQDLQQAMACFRVFAAPEFHELIVQHLDPTDIVAATTALVPQVVPL